MSSPTATERARHIKLLVCDVDGVLTDGKLIYLEGGGEAKAFNTLDGLGLQALKASGVAVRWLTARSSDIVQRRAAELQIDVEQGAREKGEALLRIMQAAKVTSEQTAFIGDDWLDLPAFAQAGFACTVPNAAMAVRARAHWTSAARGGEGAVRELCEFIMHAQGTYLQALARYAA
jgi:3-deoxy-D-manno-octulosonate 8-phosphate phosphatase (KDO 8-P phosphatase)